jgi:hypothetical protein
VDAHDQADPALGWMKAVEIEGEKIKNRCAEINEKISQRSEYESLA